MLSVLCWLNSDAYGQKPDKAVELARQYLASEDDDTRTALAKQISAYDGDIETVLRKLKTRTYQAVKPGYHPQESFTQPALLEKHPDDLLYFTVPKSYRPDRPTGLIIFMHGGGAATGRKAPQWTMDFPEDEEEESDALGDVFDESGLIAVGPSAPWDEESYYEHDGGHSAHNGKPYIAKFLRSAQDLRRDPCFWHIVLASPVGYSRYYSSQVQHNRWLTLDEAADGQIEYDLLLADEDVEFDDWELEHVKRDRKGAMIEARNWGDNSLEVTTQNVRRFTVWLHPKMVDFRRPVRITVDGSTRFEETVAPSLMTALESYERRNDWGLIYHAKVELDLD